MWESLRLSLRYRSALYIYVDELLELLSLLIRPGSVLVRRRIGWWCCNFKQHFDYTMKKRKSKSGFVSGRRGGNGQHEQHKAVNAFEQVRSRKKFNILGRKGSKGDVKKVSQKRSAAVEKRKDTLLVEYRQLRKSNAFVDKRFGEDDTSLTQEEKALMRFQKQRMKELSGSKFSLADEEDEEYGMGMQLTHLGKSISDTLGEDPLRSFEDREDADDGTDVLEKYNFGGGEFDRNQDGSDSPRRKSKKEIMEEVIAKSKMYKALKAKQREEDLDETDALDVAWKNLAAENLTADLLRPKGSRSETQRQSATLMSEDDKKFDTLARELVFEAKAHAGERTLTKEELADLERQRLEELEKGRIAREKGGDDLEDDFLGMEAQFGLPAGGYAARRARLKAKTDLQDEEDSEDEDSDEDYEDGVSALEKRRRQQAAGDHPLQEQFRELAAKLLDRHGKEGDVKGILKNSAVDESGESESGMSEDDDSDSDQSDHEEEEEEEEEQEEEEEKQQHNQLKANKSLSLEEKGQDEQEEGLQMTFTPSLPESYDEYRMMMDGLDANQIHEMINRIRAYNASALSENGRKKLQTLYGCIMQHFVASAGEEEISLGMIDALVPHIIELTPFVPYYSGMLSRARLQKEQEYVKALLKDPLKKADAWPSARAILLAKLLMDIYPVTDKKHPVLTPLTTFLSSTLTLCPVVRPVHAIKGLLISHMLVNAHSRSNRIVPETLTFVISLLRSYVDYVSLDYERGDNPNWMKNFERRTFKTRKNYKVVPLSISSCFKTDFEDISQEFADSILNALIQLLKSLSNSIGVDAYEELFDPAIPLLEELSAHANAKTRYLSSHTLQEISMLLQDIHSKSESTNSSRLPMVVSAMSRGPSVKQYNPRFEDSFAKGKDYDPDRERAEERRLKKLIRKEERGAIRELRKDAAFMAGVRDREKHNLQARLDNSAKRAISFLQQQESDFKSGGQGGMWKKKKKK